MAAERYMAAGQHLVAVQDLTAERDLTAGQRMAADTLMIGGTAAYHLDFSGVDLAGEEMVATPYGPVGPVRFFHAGGRRVAFLSRHGGEGRLGVTPPFINYHGNVWAARAVGARRILSWNSAGSLVRSLAPGSLAVVADLIDWTRRRQSTFGPSPGSALGPRRGSALGGAAEQPSSPAPGPTSPPVPRDHPLFDPQLRQRLVSAAAACGHHPAPGAIYAATEGARLETRAEIDLLAQAGAELVGMTLSPEVFLARELGLVYGSLCWVSNYATGIPFDGPEQRLFGPEVGDMMFRILLHLLREEGAAHA